VTELNMHVRVVYAGDSSELGAPKPDTWLANYEDVTDSFVYVNARTGKDPGGGGNRGPIVLFILLLPVLCITFSFTYTLSTVCVIQLPAVLSIVDLVLAKHTPFRSLTGHIS
jgi:hypothetical protein